MPGVRTVRAYGLVRHIARAAFYPVVHAQLADRTDRFVIESWHAQRGTQLFVKFAQAFEMARQRREILIHRR